MPEKFSRIRTDDELMESVKHGTDRFPFQFYEETMAQFDFHCVEWHWHTELEFVLIETGEVIFQVGNSRFIASDGTGVFINSRKLHRMVSEEDAVIPNFLCLPSFVAAAGSLIFEKYMRPVLTSSVDYYVFSGKEPWHTQVLESMKEIVHESRREAPNELRILAELQRLWLVFTDHSPFKTAVEGLKVSSQARLQLMMQYIQDKYDKRISLQEIAAAANVSKSTALNLFRKTLQLSPVEYLNSYRLKQAALLLINTEKKIAAISAETGFHSVDYFCKIFKKMYQSTPTEYRNGKQGLKT